MEFLPNDLERQDFHMEFLPNDLERQDFHMEFLTIDLGRQNFHREFLPNDLKRQDFHMEFLTNASLPSKKHFMRATSRATALHPSDSSSTDARPVAHISFRVGRNWQTDRC